jgi:isoleucyl-tRNA synthetase
MLAVKHDIPIFMPVLDDGTFDAGGGPFEGNKVRVDDQKIVDWLQEQGSLVGSTRVSHSYPHCWRCKEPVIFRATEQWFVSMEKTGLRENAIEKLDSFTWIPQISSKRMSAMITDRPDWCISRQRSWGVPLPVFRCEKCGQVVANEVTFDAVIDLFKTEGADAWYTKKPSEYLPADAVCACGCGELLPETDILDVWWESGVSHTSVLKAREELDYPAQMYLEGSDQHRGWFQSSYLTSIGAYGRAPFENLLTHEFTVDGDGRKMSKSVGNVISPIDVVNKLGADIVRLWVTSSDFGQSVAISDEILDRISEAYRKIRNTFRFFLSNLDDFLPENSVAYDELTEMDQAELVRLSDLIERVTAYNDAWRFYLAQREINDYMNNLSNVYLDIVKDRLYSDAADSKTRRSAQTVINVLHQTLLRLLAPVLAYTCEEVWEFTPDVLRDAESIHLTDWPSLDLHALDVEKLRSDYGIVRAVRDAVTKALEEARDDKVVGKSQEAAVTVTADEVVARVLDERGIEALREFLIVSDVDVMPVEGAEEITVTVKATEKEKCPRCWNYRPLASDSEYPQACARCAEVLTQSGHRCE